MANSTRLVAPALVLLALCGMAPTAPTVVTITVSADGSADHRTVQAAIDAVPAGATGRHVILISPGTYKERLVVPKDKPFVTLRGKTTDPSQVVLTYDLHAKSVIPPATQPVGTTGSSSTFVHASDFTAENVTFENPSGHIAQAVAIKTTSDRVIFRNCRFIGGQDTLYPDGFRHYFVDCYIEGRVDFIFGRATAIFERCRIHSKNGGFVTAPSTAEDRPYGFVFLNCTFTGDGEQKAYLGRPWRDFGATAVLRSNLGDHLRPEGWHHWQPHREKTARFSEHRNKGPGADRSKRVAWSRELTDEEAAEYTIENILAGPDAWDPRK